MNGDLADGRVLPEDGDIAVRQADECARHAVCSGVFGADGDRLTQREAASWVNLRRNARYSSFGDGKRLAGLHFCPLAVPNGGDAG